MSSHQQGMSCPVDGTQLVMSERQGIEIDYCPACRGVWLDRGELDKILERSTVQAPPAQQPAPQHHAAPQHHHYDHKKRRKSFLEELFD
jgi:Zn-finger nucleic acid-binding protein